VKIRVNLNNYAKVQPTDGGRKVWHSGANGTKGLSATLYLLPRRNARLTPKKWS
jgi:hypothetical protein